MKLLPFEKMSPNIKYAFTLNVASDGGGNLGERVANYIAFCKKYMQHCKFIIYPEISKIGRLHYHGYIWFSTYEDIFLFNMNVMPLLATEKYGDIEIDTIQQEFGNIYWYCYIRKMKHLMKPYMTKNHIMYKISSDKLGPIKTAYVPHTIKGQLLHSFNLDNI